MMSLYSYSCKIYLSKLVIIFVSITECICLILHYHMIYRCTPILVLPTMSIWDFNLNGSTNKRLAEPPSSMNFQNFRYLTLVKSYRQRCLVMQSMGWLHNIALQECTQIGLLKVICGFAWILHYNKLASLKAMLVWNYDPPTDVMV